MRTFDGEKTALRSLASTVLSPLPFRRPGKADESVKRLIDFPTCETFLDLMGTNRSAVMMTRFVLPYMTRRFWRFTTFPRGESGAEVILDPVQLCLKTVGLFTDNVPPRSQWLFVPEIVCPRCDTARPE